MAHVVALLVVELLVRAIVDRTGDFPPVESRLNFTIDTLRRGRVGVVESSRSFARTHCRRRAGRPSSPRTARAPSPRTSAYLRPGSTSSGYLHSSREARDVASPSALGGPWPPDAPAAPQLIGDRATPGRRQMQSSQTGLVTHPNVRAVLQ